DVSNPDKLALLATPETATREPTAAVIANGSGTALLAGTVVVSPFAEAPVLDLFDVSDPSNSNSFLTRLALPAEPAGVALASGIAYVADGTGGLQVVNYLPFDTKGQSPTVSISTTVADVDPNTPGVQVLEGASIPVQVSIHDDVQVRSVELLVNGTVVQNDVSFPYDNLLAVAPTLASGASTVTLQVRATDTGGKSALSNAIALGIFRDTTPPQIVSLDPADGATPTQGLQAVRLFFSEPLAAATVSGSNFQLL